MTTLAAHRMWEDGKVIEMTTHMPSYAKAKEMRSIALHTFILHSGFNTDYGSSEPLKTLVMLCYVMLYPWLP